jgi:hypothetical protein
MCKGTKLFGGHQTNDYGRRITIAEFIREKNNQMKVASA